MRGRRNSHPATAATRQRAKTPQDLLEPLPVTSFHPKTELGRRLWRLRLRIVASGQPLLDWAGIDREMRERRGEANQET